jgi:hypothetical protein
MTTDYLRGIRKCRVILVASCDIVEFEVRHVSIDFDFPQFNYDRFVAVVIPTLCHERMILPKAGDDEVVTRLVFRLDVWDLPIG